MKYNLSIDACARLFSVVTEGAGDEDGLMAMLKAIITHPQWLPGFHILLDHRNLRIDGITATGIEAVSTFFKQVADQLGPGKIALVMRRDIDFGIARAWELATQHDVQMSIGVFRSMDEAVQWLRADGAG